MMKPILEIRNIGKKYKLHHLAGGYLSLRERMANALKFERSTTEDFWALSNISFDVQAGESIGIIGRNGAGKSTLLKILSKITPPTTGHIVSRGRIASLLEVGTGFHPELSGRENIFFNGSLLGMKRREIESKFDEIVDFSGVEKFLDTSLKHFSSGMQLRLAFAVAAFLEPEILIIDEVLAVGDIEFQKKCMGKMAHVSKSGRTILFVSHNMDAVSMLCQRGVLLNKGQVEKNDMVDAVVASYVEKLDRGAATFSDENVRSIEINQLEESLLLTVTYECKRELNFPNLGFAISDQFGHPITGTNVAKAQVDIQSFKRGVSGRIEVEIKNPKLSFGTYQLEIWLGDQSANFFETKDPIRFSIEAMAVEMNRNSRIEGFVIPECKWSFFS
jgi:lipopolysaccharide transport system ATP-binding protein